MTKEEKLARRAQRKAERKARGKAFRDDFKKFIARGNVMDLAVAVVVGGAFGKITTALVSGIIMPVIALLTGSMNMEEMKIILKPEVLGDDGAVITAESAIMYGTLIQAILDFLIIAFTIFVVFRIIKKVGEYTAKKLEQGKEMLQNIINKDECDEVKPEENPVEVVVAPAPEPAPAPVDNNAELVAVLTEIRDLLKAEEAEDLKQEN